MLSAAMKLLPTEYRAMTPKQDAMIARALSFTADQVFDGYPTTSETDITLIHESAAEAETEIVFDHFVFVLTAAAKTKEEAANAKRYYDAYVENMWLCNASESSNPAFDEE